jgi:hypothetical protein
MKQIHFGWRSSALSSLGLLAAFAIATASGGCKIELPDGDSAGSDGDGSAGVTATGKGGATTASGGATTANGGVPSTSDGGAANAATQAGSANAGAGASGGARSTSIYQEDCANPDPIPNDERERAIDFGAGAIVCPIDSSDSDWFYVDTPNDGRAHVIQLDITETEGSWIDIDVTAAKDGSFVGRIHPSQRGLKLTGFLTVGPGTRTLFDVNGYLENTDTATINVSLTPEADDHEPNNDRASATLIQPASEISAQLILPYVSASDQQIQDWYKVELAAGEHTFELTAVPTDLYPDISVSDSTNAKVKDSQRGPNRGATFSFDFDVEQAGTYYFEVESVGGEDVISTGTKAKSYTQPYKFRID